MADAATRRRKRLTESDAGPGSLLTVPLEVDGLPKARIRIGLPHQGQHRMEWRCLYSITGLSAPSRGHVSGMDSLQALVLTLQLMPTLLSETTEAKQGRLTMHGMGPPWGFPDALYDHHDLDSPGAVVP